jgi:hypothetical protein
MAIASLRIMSSCKKIPNATSLIFGPIVEQQQPSMLISTEISNDL